MTRTVTWHKDTHADVSAPSRPLALISVLSFCGVLDASLFIIYLRIKNAAGASSIPRPRKEDDLKDTCDGTNCQPGAGPQGEMHTARHVFLISAPPLLRRISLISTVCNATTFSQARCVHEHLKALGQAETTRPTKSSMTDPVIVAGRTAGLLAT